MSVTAIPPLRRDIHAEVERLLPWYATGRLELSERARVERHLAECAVCQAELRIERKLEAQVADLSLPVERGWAELRRRATERPPVPRAAVHRIAAGWRDMRSAGKMGWLLAAQIAIVLIGAEALPVRHAPSARYQALGAAPSPRAGNLIVIFRPDASEHAMRRALNAAGAHVVGGPTAADAYVLHVAPATIDASLGRLRGDANITLAQPIDAGGAR